MREPSRLAAKCCDKIADMRELSDNFKLSVRSLSQVFGVLNDLDSAFGRTMAIKFRGKRLTREAIVNAAILHLGSLGSAEQERALTAAIARLEAMLSDDPAPAAPAVDLTSRSEVSGEEPPPRTNRKRGPV
jgi:hypothetical protein